jgi:hypothetical protein
MEKTLRLSMNAAASRLGIVADPWVGQQRGETNTEKGDPKRVAI